MNISPRQAQAERLAALAGVDVDTGGPVPNGNGKEATLPEDRQAAVAYGLAQFQTICAERDASHRENIALKTENAGLKVAVEALEAHRTEMESRVQSATLVRDQAVADRAVYETLFVSIQAQMRAFAVPAAPLVKDADQ
jgi:hypothetical protein